jgi:hypothetical protein
MLLDNGDYVPRSVYFIDENGNPSPAHPVSSVKMK